MFDSYTTKFVIGLGDDLATVTPGSDDGHARRKLRTLGCVEVRPGTFEADPAQLRKYLDYHFPRPARPRTPAQKRADKRNLARAHEWQQANARANDGNR